jgi:hypothetical protein
MTSPFDYIKSINNKRDVPETIDGYEPYITNHTLSAFQDTVLLANEMNCRPHLDKQMQFDFYYYGVRQRNRFDKWLKAEKNQDIENIAKFYGYSKEKAKQVKRILTKEQLTFIENSFDTGGIQK